MKIGRQVYDKLGEEVEDWLEENGGVNIDASTLNELIQLILSTLKIKYDGDLK